MKRLLITAVAAALLVMVTADTARADRKARADRWGARFARTMPWHGPYAYTAAGQPLALVVPPTAHMQVKWGWGVSQTESVPIYHQFMRPYPGDTGAVGWMGGPYLPTPAWPSHTDQFGVYYVRGPW